jgi:hypothetical protein
MITVELTCFYSGMAALVTIVSITHGPTALTYIAIPSVIPLLYSLVNRGIIGRCKSLAISTREMAELGKLETRNKDNLKGNLFKLLEWMNRRDT